MKLHDLRLGFRGLRKEPLSAVITIFTLALGIGLCATSFSLLYGVFLRGLPVPEASRVTLIYRNNPTRHIDYGGVPQHDFYDWRAQQTSFEGLAAYTTGTVNLADGDTPE